MSIPRCRLLPFALAHAPRNMAADEMMLQSAAAGVAALRFYGWSPATLSLGYFQPSAGRLSNALLAELPWVRRLSGGEALVHDRELTYALALPAGAPWQLRGESWIKRMHEVLRQALAEFGVVSSLCEKETRSGEFLCFLHATPCDLLIGDAKIAGSAQRRRRGALLQHGSVLLAQSASMPLLPGIADLTGSRLEAAEVAAAVCEPFELATGWKLEESEWAESKLHQIEEIAVRRYESAAWNEKR